MPIGCYTRTPAHRQSMSEAHRGKPAHNRGRCKDHLGHAHSRVQRLCETCGKAFTRLVKNVRISGGRFCSKVCNPAYAPRFTPQAKHRRHNLKRNYGITVEEFDRMEAAQGGLCAICHAKPLGKKCRLVIDHDHRTGRIRKLLCNSCNRALGWFGDDPKRLAAAIEYLRQHDDNQADALWISETVAVTYQARTYPC